MKRGLLRGRWYGLTGSRRLFSDSLFVIPAVLAGISVSTGSTTDDVVWPKFIDRSKQRVETEMIPPGEDRETYVYQGRRFELNSAEELGDSDVAALFTVLESIEPAMRALPLPLLGERSARRPYRVRVFSDEQAYLEYGGIPGSVGMYSGRHRETLMLRASLFGHTARSVPAKMAPLDERFDVLVHEVTHQLMARWASILPPWYYEGHAEYLAVAHDRPGHFQFQNMEPALAKHIRRFVVRGRGPIEVPSIARLLGMGNRQWLRNNRLDSDENYHKYAGALVLTHYYYHLDSRNGEAMRDFLQALRGGDSRARATKEHLVGERDLGKIESRLVAYWRRHGLSLAFGEE